MEFAVNEFAAGTVWPVTVEEMKVFSRVDGDDEDELIQSLIEGVTGEAEDITHRCFAQRTYELVADLPAEEAVLPVFPCEVVGVTVDGEAVDSSLYTLSKPSSTGRHARPAVFVPLDGFPEEGQLIISVSAGGGVPAPVATWIKTRVSTLYEQRESHAMFNTGLKFVEMSRDYALALLDPYILHGGF